MLLLAPLATKRREVYIASAGTANADARQARCVATEHTTDLRTTRRSALFMRQGSSRITPAE